MKKSSIVITIISAVLVAIGAVLLIFAPTLLQNAGNYTGASDATGIINVIKGGLVSNLKDLIDPSFYGSGETFNATLLLLPIVLAVLAILWLVNLIALIVKKRPGALFVNIVSLIFGFVGFMFLDMLISPNWWSDGKNVIGYIVETNQASESGLGFLPTLLILLPYILAGLGFVLAIAALLISIVDVNKYPGKARSKRDGGSINEPLYDASDAQSDAEAREIVKNEIKEEAVAPTPIATIAPTPNVVSKDGYTGSSPTIVQYIYNNGSTPSSNGDHSFTKDDIRSIVAEELGKKNASVDNGVETIDENELMTTDDLRSIIREEVNKGKKEETPVAPAKEETAEETSNDSNDEVLTSDDLRSIIAEEIAKAKGEDIPVEVVHDDEEDSEPEALTSDDLRKIIAEEIAKANKKEDKAEPVEEKPVEEKKEEAPKADDTEILTSDDLRSIIREEISSSLGSDEVVTEEDKPEEKEETVSAEEPEVLTSDDLRKIIAEEVKKAMEPEIKEVEEEESEIATTDDLRSIIRDELSSQVASEAPVVEEEEEEVTPLTANDLRTLIQEALDEHDNPERRELTEDEARDIIVEQIRSYYASKKESDKEDKKALKEKEAAEAKAKEEEARRLALEKKLEDEIAAREKERAEREADRKERLESEKNRETVSLDDIREIIRGELSSYKPAVVTEKADDIDEKGIKEIIRSELASFRAEQAKASEEAAQEAMDAHLIEQARAEAEAEESKAQSEEIKNLKANAVTSDDVRSIIAEELDKRFAAFLKAQEESKKAAEPAKEEPKKEAPKALEEKKETIVIEVKAPEEKKEETKKEAPVVAEAKVEEKEPSAEEKAKIIRIPFNERMLSADKETQNNYNELKAECLSYGLKSRLSNSGDTFRLHTKTYVKIVVAGKGLKLYLALDPKAYENNPIPLHDAGNKNIYKDIPGVFKVKSALSLRRAKQLIADACEKDGLEQGKIVPHNYAKELKDYVPQLGKKDDGDEE